SVRGRVGARDVPRDLSPPRVGVRPANRRAEVVTRVRAGGDLPGARRRRHRAREGDLVLDERVRAVLERLEREDEDERARGLPPAQRSRAVAPTTGRFLFALVAPQTDCEVLEI